VASSPKLEGQIDHFQKELHKRKAKLLRKAPLVLKEALLGLQLAPPLCKRTFTTGLLVR